MHLALGRRNMTILMACERSGGHIFPALVLAKKLKYRYGDDCTIYFFLTADFLKDTVEKEGYRVIGKAFKKRFLLFEIIYRFCESIILLLKVRPQKVIGFGGRDSFFLVLFARLFGAKSALYEPNVEFGKANKVLAKFVNVVLTGFQSPSRFLKKSKTVGIPLRSNLRLILRTEALRIFSFNENPVILCFGGSQGSLFLNNLMKYLTTQLPQNCQFLHFTGKQGFNEMQDFYGKSGRPAFVRDFYYNMEEAYSAADIVICRSGASTVAEIAYFALPAIFIPHPAASGHQQANAMKLVGVHGAKIFSQNNFSQEEFAQAAKEIIFNKDINYFMRKQLSGVSLGVKYEEFCKNIDI